MQEDFVGLMRKLAPDLAQELATRALVLERIAALEPVGRRQLAARLNLPEREVRAAATSLKEQELIELDAAGMGLTDKAREMLPQVRTFSRAMQGLTEMESRLAQLLNVRQVHIAPGSVKEDPRVLQDVGRLAAIKIRAVLQSGNTLAVTGGTTMARTAQYLQSTTPLNVMVVPARGGLARAVETQANTLAAEIAQRLGGHHRLIHLPDHIDPAAKQEMMKLPEVKEAIDLVQRADVILHGIGRADVAAREYALRGSVIRRLEEQGAVGEALGSYFDQAGQCLLKSSSVGVDLARLTPNCQMIAVAAGSDKAQAIIAVLRHDPHAMLVTDEGAAQQMLRLLEN